LEIAVEAQPPTYEIYGIGIDIGDSPVHGKDERVRALSFDDGLEFCYRYPKVVSGGTSKG
jgi:hypothetical protein